jgi:hypothetical protein
MDIQFTETNEQEIRAAAELYHLSPAEYVRRSTLWVVLNCAEIGGSPLETLYKSA